MEFVDFVQLQGLFAEIPNSIQNVIVEITRFHVSKISNNDTCWSRKADVTEATVLGYKEFQEISACILKKLVTSRHSIKLSQQIFEKK